MAPRITVLMDIYKSMSEDHRQEEIDSLFDIIYAMLEACESDSIEAYPNPEIKLKFSCEVIKAEGKYYC